MAVPNSGPACGKGKMKHFRNKILNDKIEDKWNLKKGGGEYSDSQKSLENCVTGSN